MNKTLIIARHEFRVTIRRLSFIIMTILFPLLGVIGILIFQFVQRQGGEVTFPGEGPKLGYVDETGGFNDPGSFTPYPNQETAKAALLSREINQYLVIPSDYLASGRIIRYSLKSQLPPSDPLEARIRDFLVTNLLSGETSPQLLERVRHPLNLATLRLDETGNIVTEGGQVAGVILAYLLGILLAISIFTSSGFLLQGLGEEKENRVMEVLLSSVSATQLMVGKVLGLGAAGLAQMAFWLVSARAIAALASTSLPLGEISIPASLIILGLVYFILGYLLFAIIMAGVGAIATTFREGQQLASIITGFAVIPLFFTIVLIESPYSLLARALTLFPLTAPIATMQRLGVAHLPPWEVGLSVVIMGASIVLAMLVAIKVFRVGMLMYGKRPGFRELVRYVREG